MSKFNYCFLVRAAKQVLYKCNVFNYTKPSSIDEHFMYGYSLAEAVTVYKLVSSKRKWVTIRFTYKTSANKAAYLYVSAFFLDADTIQMDIYDWIELPGVSLTGSYQTFVQNYIQCHRCALYPAYLKTVLQFTYQNQTVAVLADPGKTSFSVSPLYYSDLRSLLPDFSRLYRCNSQKFDLLDYKYPALDMCYSHEWNLSLII